MASTSFGPGTLLAGRFTLEDLLSEAGGARLWRATDEILARSVSVHVLPREDRRADALLLAARTSATVTEPHLLRVLDAATEDDVVYVVNEWGSGMSLDRILQDGPLSPRRAAWMVKEVAEAVSVAHRHGVAHGRLLPENVMVTDSGSVKLIGFVVDAVLRGRHQPRVSGGPAIGEHESDVVNLGGLLYAALVGRWPGTEGSSLTPAPVEHGRPLRPRQVRAGVPRPLDRVCDRILNAADTGAVPLETAHEIYAALSDYIGDPMGAQTDGESTRPVALPDRDSTTVMSAALFHDDDVQASSTNDPEGGDDSEAPGQDPDERGRVEQPAADAGATQAGMPIFFDEDTAVGWASSPANIGGHPDGTGSDGTGSDGTGSEENGSDGTGRAVGAAGAAAAASAATARTDDRTDARIDARTDARTDDRTQDRTGREAGGRPPGRGAGALPLTWGPDAGSAPPREPEPDDRPAGGWVSDGPGTSWLRLAAVVGTVVLVVAGLVVAFNLGRGSTSAGPGADSSGSPSSPSSSSSPSSTPVRVLAIRGVSDFDPEASPPEENPQLAPLAIDGNPSTAWTTVTYQGNPQLGGLKSGVGLLIDLGRQQPVGQVKVSLNGSPTSLQLLAAPGLSAEPTTRQQLKRVAGRNGAGEQVRFDLSTPVKTRWLAVWLTSLPANNGGYQGQIAEITVRS